MSKVGIQINKMCYAALFLALGWLLPILTGQIEYFGSMLCPMHIPVMIAGFVLGPIYGAVIGFITPLTRSLFFGMPRLFPTSIGMAFELFTYGLMCGLMFKIFNKLIKKDYIFSIYISLIIAMIVGRGVYGLVSYILTFMNSNSTPYTFYAFISGTFLQAWPGIILQLILIPIIIRILLRFKIIQKFSPELFINDFRIKDIEQNA